MKHLTIVLVTFLLSQFTMGQVAVTDPTTLTLNPLGNPINPICGVGGGDLLGESGGQTFRYTHTWPAYETPCLLYGVDTIIDSLLDANASGPPSIACTGAGLDSVVYNSGLSDLANGVIVYTGTTDYYYQATTLAWVTRSFPVRLTLTFTTVAGGTPISASVLGSRIYIPTTEDFDMHAYITVQAPTTAPFPVYCAAVTPGAWYGFIEMFDLMQTDINQKTCTNFTPGSYFETTVTSTASNTGPANLGDPVDLLGAGTGLGTLTYNWTGPNSYGTQNVNIASAAPADSGEYFLTVTDMFGCTALDSTVLVVVQDTDGDGILDPSDNCVNTPNPLQTDVDGDGFGTECDCDDNDPLVNSGVAEIACNGIDDDCNPLTPDDGVPPVAVCQDITVYLDGAGNATITGSDIDGGSSDNCGIASLTPSVTSFTCADIGIVSVDLTVMDNEGNTDVCTAQVTVADTTSPVASCQNITVFLDGAGNATITGSDIDAGSTDNCGIASLTPSVSSFTCADVGVVSVDLTVTDNNGNSDICTAQVTVADTTSPVASCQNITVFLDAAGSATITGSDIDAGSTDNCGIASLTPSVSSFTCADVGVVSVDLTVTDNSGNTDICTAQVTVADTTSPVASCQNITVFLDGTGNATITGSDIDAGSTDNCGIASVTPSVTSFTCADVGVVSVDLTVTDSNGNTDICTAQVTVADTTSPVASCQVVTVFLDGTGNATITGADIDGGSTDNCGIASLIPSVSSFTCVDVGVVSVDLTVTDNNGNTDVCTTQVTVADTTSPVASCQDITVYLDGTGNATITGADIDGGSTDNCGIASLTPSVSSFTCADVGVVSVDLTVTDNSGNTDVCSAQVTIADTTSPVASCQDITVYLDGTGNATITGADIDGGSTDNCGIASLTPSVTTFTCSDIGVVSVDLTVTDNNGNTDVCTAQVTVADTTSPVASCQDITVYLDGAGNASITGNDIDGGSTDNCGIASLTPSVTAFTCADAGVVSVDLTVTDNNGNTDVCTAQVTVADTTSPVASCQDITVYLDAAGNATITGADIDGGSTDNCGIASLTPSITSFTCADIGVVSVDLTVTDNSGNTDVCTSQVTVADNTAPVAVCQDITVYLDATGNATITGADIDGGSTDNCGIASLTSSISSFTCADIGVVAVDLTVTDNSGNTDVCTAQVTVADNTAPVAVCQDITVYLDAAGNASITGSDIDGGSTDNCGIASITPSVTSFTCADAGVVSVDLTVTDNSGNTNVCTAQVTVADTTSPVASCQDITVYLDATGNATIVGSDVDGGSTDNCGIASLTPSITSFGCSDIGVVSVDLTVTDNSGNTDVCTAQVTIADTTSPNALCQDATIYLDATGVATIDETVVDAGTTDNCSLASLSVSMTDFDCSNLGVNTVQLTATDASGNVSVCSSDITIVDDLGPIVECPTNLSDTTDFSCEIEVDDYTGTLVAADQCDLSNVSISQFPTAGTIVTASNQNPEGTSGEVYVTITVEDQSGNSTTCDLVIDLICFEDIFIPGFFSPNDDGKNDLFVIDGLPGYDSNSLVIFNRWGNEVFRMENYDNSWDGSSSGPMTVGSGRLPVGTYYYILELNSGDEIHQGYVELRK